jgi:endonuclease-3
MPQKTTAGSKKKKTPKTRAAPPKGTAPDRKGRLSGPAQKALPRRGKRPDPGRADDAKRITQMIEILAREFPDAHCMLDHSSAFELLVATILAAQCTDAMVNQVTRTLFEKFPAPGDYADAPTAELEQEVYRTGFYRNKTKSLKKCCRSLIERHGGKVPSTMEELIALGGVGRKTANCILGVSFGIPGIVVDTHVRRLSRRMGYTEETNPDKIERDLMAIAPEHEWTHMSHLLADLGRSYCNARRPRCDECPVEYLCPKNLDG